MLYRYISFSQMRLKIKVVFTMELTGGEAVAEWSASGRGAPLDGSSILTAGKLTSLFHRRVA